MGKVKIENLKDKIEFLQNNLVKNKILSFNRVRNITEDYLLLIENLNKIIPSMIFDEYGLMFEDECEDIVFTGDVTDSGYFDEDDEDGTKNIKYVFKLDDKYYAFDLLYCTWFEPYELKLIKWLGEVKPKEIIIKETIYEQI